MNLLNPLRPLARRFPTVAKPITKMNMQQKTVFTGIALFIYLVCSQIPIYGVIRSHQSDPLYWARLIMASSRGTLMELGISPIISAGWLIQILTALGLFKVNSKQDEKDAEGLEGVLAVLFCLGEALVTIHYGTYGVAADMSYTTIALIVFQLTGAGLLVILLDDMLRKGYGLGSGISLFICANTSQTIAWFAFSPVTMTSQFGVQFQGAIIAFVHFLMTKQSFFQAFWSAFWRKNGFNLSQLFGSVFVFFILIYLQRFTARVKVINQQYSGWVQTITIKLFYTSNMSVILQSMIISNFYRISQVLSFRFEDSTIVNILGKWQGQKVVGGLIWYISPPFDQEQAWIYPHRTFLYTCFVCYLCAKLAKIWMVMSKSGPKDIAKMYRNRNMTLPNYEQQSLIGKLNDMIPTAAMLGGIVIGFMTVLGDLLDVAGSSTGILLSITILYSYYQKIFDKEKIKHDF